MVADWSYIFWRDDENKRDGRTLYGTGFYQSQRDDKYVTGGIQQPHKVPSL
jgi:hypothetical protein